MIRNGRNGFIDDLVTWLRGLCMGAADIVPGVSGGTVALILGHYERLVTAISHIDGHFIGLLRRRQLVAALQYADIRFLIWLAIGMATGIIALAAGLHYLLEHFLAYTFAAFTGLILASSLLVARRVSGWNGRLIAWLLCGAIAAWLICLLQPVSTELTAGAAFLCAMVAICAMILPGISGAFVLLLLGVYHPITELIKGLPHGELTVDGLIILSSFVCGCGFGLLAFSRALKWLLAHKHDHTMSFLVGLMLGSLYKIWPFQQVTPATAGLPFKEQSFEHVWPLASSANPWGVVALVALAGVVALGLEQLGTWLGKRSNVQEANV